MTEQSELALKRLREMKGQPYRRRRNPDSPSTPPDAPPPDEPAKSKATF
jgi:hypothetical protein